MREGERAEKGQKAAASKKTGKKKRCTVRKVVTPKAKRSPYKTRRHTKTKVPDTSDDEASSDTGESDSDGVCAECGTNFKADDEQSKESWVGCDTCPRWFHYYCVTGLSGIPDGFWSCLHCSGDS